MGLETIMQTVTNMSLAADEHVDYNKKCKLASLTLRVAQGSCDVSAAKPVLEVSKRIASALVTSQLA